jgi:hypothetical protein
MYTFKIPPICGVPEVAGAARAVVEEARMSKDTMSIDNLFIG